MLVDFSRGSRPEVNRICWWGKRQHECSHLPASLVLNLASTGQENLGKDSQRDMGSLTRQKIVDFRLCDQSDQVHRTVT